jgi:CrcB protein
VKLLWIGLAGAFGSMSRHLVSLLMHRLAPMRMPIGTFTVNVLGAMIIGLIMAVFEGRGALDSRVRVALTVGFLGGFTTYSSFALETVGLLEEKRVVLASFYVGLTLVCAGIACFVGLSIGRRI